MAKFWLATFTFPAVAAPPMGNRMMADTTPLALSGAKAWAIEIIEDGNERAVLLSTVNGSPLSADGLVCRIGFANSARSCAVWGDRGFPLNDAIIDLKRFTSGALQSVNVRSQCFLSQREMQYDPDLFSLTNDKDPEKAPAPSALAGAYTQALQSADVVLPATRIQQLEFDWVPKRWNVQALRNVKSSLKVAPSRYRALIPFSNGEIGPSRFWEGEMDLPQWRRKSTGRLKIVNRKDVFGPAAFRFEDVEILGFRLVPRDRGPGGYDALSDLVSPLNFHQDPQLQVPPETRSALSDFRYRPATRVMIVELLRYGKMKFLSNSPPLDSRDYQSQHELMARIQVGRVDDDTAQARDPAEFVPAIFVDNPWSKSIGRSVQGFDKQMANFCVLQAGRPLALRPDGRASARDEHPQPLASIREIRLSALTEDKPSGPKLLEIDCPFESMTDWNSFVEIDPAFLFGPITLSPTMRWRQADFIRSEYRRSFARTVARSAYKQLGSVQSSPVGGPHVKQKLQRTLVEGRFFFRGPLRVVLPRGTVGLTFHRPDKASAGWRALGELLGADRITIPAWSWYRFRCSMDLKVDESFAGD
jgi:hypothetical protein